MKHSRLFPLIIWPLTGFTILSPWIGNHKRWHEMKWIWNEVYMKWSGYEMKWIWNKVDIKWSGYEMKLTWNEVDMKWSGYERKWIWNEVDKQWSGYEIKWIRNEVDMKWSWYEVKCIWNEVDMKWSGYISNRLPICSSVSAEIKVKRKSVGFEEPQKLFSETTEHSDVEILHHETFSEQWHCNQPK